MPTYAYECTGCGHAFEAFQKMSDDPLVLCESCGGELKKRLFPVGIQFKGAGFYVNDYARKGKETSTESSASTPPSKAATKSDAPASTPKTETPAAPSSGTSEPQKT